MIDLDAVIAIEERIGCFENVRVRFNVAAVLGFDHWSCWLSIHSGNSGKLNDFSRKKINALAPNVVNSS